MICPTCGQPVEKVFAVREQTIIDPMSGLTLEFHASASGSWLRISGACVPFGNRQFEFGEDGVKDGSSTYFDPPLPWPPIRPKEEGDEYRDSDAPFILPQSS